MKRRNFLQVIFGFISSLFCLESTKAKQSQKLFDCIVRTLSNIGKNKCTPGAIYLNKKGTELVVDPFNPIFSKYVDLNLNPPKFTINIDFGRYHYELPIYYNNETDDYEEVYLQIECVNGIWEKV